MRFLSEKLIKRRKGSSADCRRAARNQLRFEALESRQLLAGVPELLREINFASEPIDSNPENFVQVGAISYFTASTTTTGRELWKSDGTEAGTVRVKDIRPGSASSEPELLTNVNGTLYFVANDGRSGAELWKSNGTEAGTVRVKDIRAGGFGAAISELTNVNGTLFFNANDGLSGFELWKSNGSELGTLQVKDIRVGSGNSYPRNLTNVNGTLFFSARSTSSSYELWRSNGADAGTVLVKAGFSSSGSFGTRSLTSLTNVNGTVFFVANDGTNGYELWKSNGIATGTVRVKDIHPGTSSSLPGSLTNVNGTLYFSANDGANGTELWKSNGTAAGTIRVKDIRPGTSSSSPGSLTNVNGTLYFSANDGANGTELWKSNGTEAGTVQVTDIGIEASSSSPSLLTNVNGTLFFTVDNGNGSRSLWKSNGTDAGTLLVADIDPDVGLSSPAALANVNGTLFFSANDGTAGFEVWKSNGTAAGTTLVKDISPNTVDSNARNLVNVNGTMFFTASDPTNGTELWKTNGTLAGTVRVKDINPGPANSNPRSLININGTLFFSATDGTFSGLWKSDGTEAGTVLVTNESVSPENLTNVNGTLFFSASNDANGTELWKSNGTAAGTVIVKDIFPGSEFILGPNSSIPSQLINVNGTLFFAASDVPTSLLLRRQFELWKSDGTALGTVRVKASRGVSPVELTNVNGTLFFASDSGSTVLPSSSLWKSDGTDAGTARVSESVVNPNSLTNVNGTLFFSALSGNIGEELWKSNGTATGTVLVKDIRPGLVSSNIRNLTNVNGTLFFSANDGTEDEGGELWKSNGISAGTVRVTDIFAGGGSSQPFSFVNSNGKLFFSATNGINGHELWASDGTVTGTQMVSDVVQGSGGSNPVLLAEVNGNLLFTANTETLGRELWILRSGATMHSVAIEAASATKKEGQSVNSPFTFTVTRSGTLEAATVNYAVTGIGTSPATAADFVGSVLPSGVVTFAAGQATRIITIPVRDDKSVEANESFQVTLSGATGGATIVAATATGSILNDDTSLAIAATDASKNEGNLGIVPFTFTITRTGDLSGFNSSVNYAVTGVGTNPAIVDDFIGSVLPNGIATFAVGQTTRLITIPIRADKLVEADESFRVTISNATDGATITRASADGLIINDDAPPAPSLAIAATSASKNEGSGPGTAFTFTVTRSNVLTAATTVNYAVTGLGASSATAADFVGGVLPSGVVTFAAGQATRVITIPVRGDTIVEPNESFAVTLSNASGGATITTATANGLIRNDDSVLTIAATSASKNEGNGATTLFTFTVSRTGFLTGAATVNYAVTGLGANPATAADFVGGVLPSGVVSFAVGQTSRTITVPVIGDSIVEADEEFRVTLSGASLGVTLATTTANGLIRNDDSGLAIAATSAANFEGLSGLTVFNFTVTRTGLLTGPTSIFYAVTGQGVNPATNTDFLNNVLPRGTLSFAAGETTKIISILVKGDAVVEADEGFLVTLSGPRPGTSLITALASGLIRNDDA